MCKHSPVLPTTQSAAPLDSDGRGAVTPDDTEIEVVATPPDEPAWVFLIVAFTILAFTLAFPNPTRFHSDIAGNSGDSFFDLWIMRSVQQALPHGWNALWNLPIYYPARTTLAYSDTLFPVALVHWLYTGILGDAGAFNTIYLGSWVLSSWCAYRVARRYVSYWGAAFIAALAYTYASVRLVEQEHFQLVVGGALVPLALLLLLRLLERPSPGRGATLGLTLACLMLTASYYGPLTAMIVAIVAIGSLLTRVPTRGARTSSDFRSPFSSPGRSSVRSGSSTSRWNVTSTSGTCSSPAGRRTSSIS